MIQTYRCAQGHEWRARPSSGTAAACPQCGATGEALPGDADSAPAYDTLDEMPPPPSAPATTPTPMTGPSVPGFEIIEELGRGGMGVVYKARQLNLNRVVALKMLLAGAHAGQVELARFRSEAEAVARLQHPNIVQIHDIGQHDNHAYFSLEYVDGGSLARTLVQGPLPPRQAAALVETLARAVHRAHQRGIIHRDLKPANILLTADDGIPKITDFGLAKRVDDESGLTRSGAVMGTPSYMAPEQAEGRTKDISPGTDVYALGAILYETLTGRPPFRDITPLKTLYLVLTERPVPPAQVNPEVPAALERICLRCLEKDAGKRPASAQELADALHRFLIEPEATDELAVSLPDQTVELKPARRRGALVLGLLALAALVGGLLVGGPWMGARKDASRDDEQALRKPVAPLPEEKKPLEKPGQAPAENPAEEKKPLDKVKPPEIKKPADDKKPPPKPPEDKKPLDVKKPPAEEKKPPVAPKPGIPVWQVFRITDRDEKFERLAFVDRERGFAASRSGVYRTLDGGADWQRVHEATFPRVHCLVFTDARSGWLGSDRLLSTRDGGANWQETSLPEPKGMRNVMSLAAGADGGLLMGGSNQVGELLLFRKPPGKDTWDRLDPAKAGYWGEAGEYRLWHLGALAHIDAQEAIAVVYRGNPEGGALWRTRDGGDTWKRTLSLDDTDLYRICFAGADRGWLTGANGSWWKTEDGGRRWLPLDRPDEATLHTISVAASGTLGIAPLHQGMILLTTDGRTWNKVDIGLGASMPATAIVDAGCAFVLDADGRVARFSNPVPRK